MRIPRIRWSSAGVLVLVAIALVPLLMTPGWLTILTLALAMAIGAIGLAMLYATGQLSLGHAFFMGVGGYAYGYFVEESRGEVLGLGLSPVLALILAVAVAGAAGALFSPIASRLGGLQLAVVTLGLVFVGQHIMRNATSLTGGSRGRILSPLNVFDRPLDDPQTLWWITVGCLVAAGLFAHFVMKGRIGLSLRALHGGEIFASTMGVNVRLRKTEVFIVSSMFAGLSGALFAVVNGALVPETFNLALSLNVLLMIVLGGSGFVVVGSIVGALLIGILPELLRENAGVLPFIAEDLLSDGIAPTEAAHYLYGFSVILLLIVEPGGLVILLRRAWRAVRRPRKMFDSSVA